MGFLVDNFHLYYYRLCHLSVLVERFEGYIYKDSSVSQRKYSNTVWCKDWFMLQRRKSGGDESSLCKDIGLKYFKINSQ